MSDEPKFTLGTWDVAEEPWAQTKKTISVRAAFDYGSTGGSRLVAKIPSGPQALADARLISAAPNLYEAASVAFDFLSGVDGAAEVRSALLAALAKASGAT